MKLARSILIVFIVTFLISSPAGAKWLDDEKKGEQGGHEKHMKMMEEEKSTEAMLVDITLHNEELLTQYGEKVKFVNDVIGDKLVAMTFIYTTCTTICPVYSAIFTDLQDLLGERIGKDVILVTMSLDPTTDIPPRMKKEAVKYKAKPGWYYLTGKKPTVDKVLRGLDAYFADFTQHPPMALVGDGKSGKWKRYNGFPKPEELLAMIDGFKMAREGGHYHGKAEKPNVDGSNSRGSEDPKIRKNLKAGSSKQKAAENHGTHQEGHSHEGHHVEGRSEEPSEDVKQSLKKPIAGVSVEEKARAYFTDLPVIDQDGNRLRFYSDVLKDRIVLITFYFTDCGDACPLIMEKLKEVQAVVGDQLGRDFFFVGLSVDAEEDTPELIREFLSEHGAGKKGWIFLTGEKKNLDHIIYKLGQYRPTREEHSTLFILGNVKKGHWSKVMPTHPSPAIVQKLKELAGEG